MSIMATNDGNEDPNLEPKAALPGINCRVDAPESGTVYDPIYR